MNLLEMILEFLFPTRCFICRRSAPSVFCEDCRAKISPIVLPSCRRCSHPLAAGAGSNLCSRCRREKPSYTRAVSAGLYRGVLRKAILLLKYRNKKRLAEPLAQLMAHKWEAEALPRPDCIIPVPLHRSRLRKRGYNQSELLARRLGERFQVAVNSALLVRSRETSPQNRLGRLDREENVRGAFSVRCGSLKNNARVLLVDDLMTTGATLRESSLALLENGIGEVYALTAARDILERGDRS